MTLDQSVLEPKLLPQMLLFAGHFAVVALMVVPAEVQYAMQDQDLQLLR